VRILKSELLVPVGNQEALKAAVLSGADAIYLGGQKFNARRRADNFDNEQLIDAIKYAHLYGVKVYVTFNTLIKQKELSEARNFAEFLYHSNCDAVIVQDLGIAAMIKKHFPQLDLHACTQMTIHNLEGVRILEDIGFKRVVLARELNLTEIEHIAQKTSLELETFIHGALCICYSGQCLMSSILGGRSGNRGLCAQPCRLPYRLEKESMEKVCRDEKYRYLLSTRDLAAYSFLDKLVKAGIKSFKIEGRLKRPEYIGVVTGIYRKILDNIYQGNIPGYSSEDEENLLQIFNRGGFCSGYYYGTNNKELVSPDRPDHWGIHIGRVVNVRNNWVDVELESPLEVGDGIRFTAPQISEWGQEVTRMKDRHGRELGRATPGTVVSIKRELKENLVQGAKVWRISQKNQLEQAAAQFNSKYARKIPVLVRGVFKVGEAPLIEMEDLNGIKGIAIGQQKVEAAQKVPLSQETIEKQINRLGDTPFEIKRIDIDMDDGVFVPLSLINELRRMAVSELIDNRIKSMEASRQKISGKQESICFNNNCISNVINRPELYIYTDKIIQDDDILKAIDGLGFVPNAWKLNYGVLKEYISSLKERQIKTRLVLPRIMRKEDIEILDKINPDIWYLFDTYQAGNLGAIYYLKEKGIKAIIGDNSLNVFNAISIKQLADLGVQGVILSQELQYREIEDVAAESIIPCELMIFGYIPLMITEYCPVGRAIKDCDSCKLDSGYRLIDRKGIAFPLKRRKIARCYTEVLNSQVLLVVDEMEKIMKTGVRRYGINLEGYSLEEIKHIVALHRFALDNPGQRFPKDLDSILAKLKNRGYTKGHFFRGVK